MPSKRQGGMAGQPRLVPASEVAPPESESHHDEAGFGGGDGAAVQAVPRKPGPQTLAPVPGAQGLYEIANSPYGKERTPKYGWGTVFQSITAKPRNKRVHVGTSSLNGIEMPGKQTSREMGTLMTVYSRKFSCLEHCATFYRMNENSTWAKWRSHAASAGKDFRYTIKAHRLFTHDNQLEINDYTRAHLAEFFAKVRLLGPHLGAVLVQLPPSFRKSEQSLDRLRALEAVFPKDIDFAFDLRSHTMICQEVADVLAQNNWAMVWYHLVDGSGEMELTTPFFDTSSKLVYIRLHGSVQQFSGDYGKEAMREWAQKVHEAVQSRPERDVYVFFNNNESRVGKLVSSLVDATCFTEQLNALGSGKPGAKLEPPSQAAVKAEQSAGPKSEPAGQSVKREPGAEPMATGAKRPGSDDLASAPKRAKAAPAASEAAAAAAADGDSKQPASADEELSQEVVHIETPASAPKRAKAAPVASEAAAAVAVKRAKKASTRKAAGNNKAKA